MVGGWAAVTYGVDRATFDLDVVVGDDPKNLARLTTALRALDAERDLGAGVTEPLPDDPAALLATPLHAQTRHGRIDVLASAAGLSFEALSKDARVATFGDGTRFVVASKESLERMKEAIAAEADPERGDRDRRDLEELRRLPDPGLPRADADA